MRRNLVVGTVVGLVLGLIAGWAVTSAMRSAVASEAGGDVMAESFDSDRWIVVVVFAAIAAPLGLLLGWVRGRRVERQMREKADTFTMGEFD